MMFHVKHPEKATRIEAALIDQEEHHYTDHGATVVCAIRDAFEGTTDETTTDKS